MNLNNALALTHPNFEEYGASPKIRRSLSVSRSCDDFSKLVQYFDWKDSGCELMKRLLEAKYPSQKDTLQHILLLQIRFHKIQYIGETRPIISHIDR